MTATKERPGKVLIVEDDALIALFLEDSIAAAGYAVCGTAATPAEALALDDAQRPDIAIVDVRLADDADGIALARELKRRRPATAILYATGNCDEVKLREAPGEACLMKPFQAETLVAALGYVRQRAARKPSGATPPGVLRLGGRRR